MIQIEDRETAHFEAKLAKGGLPRSLWESYSAFANTDGGTIALGVKERSDKSLEVIGVEKPDDLVRDFWNAVNDRTKVSLNILSDRNVSIENDGGRKAILSHVPRAERFDRPLYINRDILGGTFRRNGEGDYRCSSEEVRAMLRDAEGKSQDLNVVDWAKPSVLDAESVHRYRNRMRICRPDHVWIGLDDETFLLRLGALGHDKEGVLRPTRAGLLMFGNEYDIVREFPAYFLDYREKFDADTRWTDRVYSSSGEWTGNVHDFYFRVYNRIAQTLKTPFKMIGGDRIDDTPVHKAIREALANCLVNADYYQPRGVVLIRDMEALDISNPGGFRVPISTAMSGGVSDPRNATILKMFNLIEVGERTGSGIPLIREAWRQMKWPEILAREEYGPERTTVRLLLPSLQQKEIKNVTDEQPKGHEQNMATSQAKGLGEKLGEKLGERLGEGLGERLGETRSRILDILKKDSFIAIPKIAAIVGVSETAIQNNLAWLKAHGFVRRVGGARGGHWEVV